MKICSKCKIKKELSEFYIRNSPPHGRPRASHRSACKACCLAYSNSPRGKANRKRYSKSEKGRATAAAYYQENKEDLLLWSKKYREENREVLAIKNKERYQRDRNKIREKKKRFDQTPRGRYSQYKAKAKERGYIFDLSLDQFESFWQIPCTYCGSEINTIGLDRMDNSIGYTLGNVTACCWPCNSKKGSLTMNEWYQWLDRVIRHNTTKEENLFIEHYEEEKENTQ